VDKNIKLLLAGSLLFAAYYLNFVKRGQQLSVSASSAINDAASNLVSSVESIYNGGNKMAINYDKVLSMPNVRAFLTLIRTGEGTLGANGYRTLFGGGLFDSFEDHPRIYVKRGNLNSSAAGAYQILARTWDDLRNNGFVLPDFTPANQDKAAIDLISRRNALNYVVNGDFVSAINLLNKEWASLPNSPYGQPVLTMQRALTILAQNGATSGTVA
jgi:lysozyme